MSNQTHVSKSRQGTVGGCSKRRPPLRVAQKSKKDFKTQRDSEPLSYLQSSVVHWLAFTPSSEGGICSRVFKGRHPTPSDRKRVRDILDTVATSSSGLYTLKPEMAEHVTYAFEGFSAKERKYVDRSHRMKDYSGLPRRILKQMSSLELMDAIERFDSTYWSGDPIKTEAELEVAKADLKWLRSVREQMKAKLENIDTEYRSLRRDGNDSDDDMRRQRREVKTARKHFDKYEFEMLLEAERVQERIEYFYFSASDQ